jgi:uncharacterized membrane protein YjgN (DUF898 family)
MSVAEPAKAEGSAVAEHRFPAVPDVVEHPFEFHGDANEYFRIWIVNLGLSIVTLGIYSAWAKVRTWRYFYANTRVAGEPFEYLAQPLPILKGRILALIVFGSYVLSGHFSPTLQLALAGVIALIAPWMVVRGLRFHARYSAWRSLNFRFVGGYGEAYIRYLLLAFAVVFSLGFAYGYVKWRQRQYMVENHRYGGKAFKFHAVAGDFFPVYLTAMGLGFLWVLIVIFAAIPLLASGFGAGPPPQWKIYSIVGLEYFGFFLIGIYVVARIANVVYNNAELHGHRFRSALRARDLMRLYIVNTLAILFSLGMLIPWAMIRMAKYRASKLTLIAQGDLAAFAAEASSEESAVGAEMDVLFDVDLGF